MYGVLKRLCACGDFFNQFEISTHPNVRGDRARVSATFVPVAVTLPTQADTPMCDIEFISPPM